ncbi:MAG: SCO family protein, partial [Motiliproteus sp.]|nr:SCO family protein [Motiliproteus sp.]
MSKRLSTLQWITTAMAVLAIAITLIVNFDRPEQSDTAYPGLGGDFTLVGNDGPVALENFRDQVVVMMFGFTYCPDICPTGLANVAAALNQLEQQQQSKVQALFISVDPDRDTPARLHDYTRYFHDNIQGIT